MARSPLSRQYQISSSRAVTPNAALMCDASDDVLSRRVSCVVVG